MKIQLVLCGLALLAFVGCAFSARDIGNWKLVKDISPSGEALHRVTIALKQRNLDKLNAIFWSVSDPASPSYGKYLTNDEVTELVSASPETLKTVISWLQQNEISGSQIEIGGNGDAIFVTAPRRYVERLFKVNLQTYQAPSGKILTRSIQPFRLPPNVARHVDVVLGVSDFPPASQKSSVATPAKQLFEAKTESSGSVVSHIIRAMARGGNKVEVTFNPKCLVETDGNYTCSRTVPDVMYFNLSTTTESAVINKTQYYISTDTSACQIINGVAQCKITIEVDYFNAVNVSVQVVFADASKSEVSYWPFPVLATPPVIPQSIWAQYSIPQDTFVTNPNATQCVVEFEQQYYSPSDLSLFFESMGLPDDTPVYVIGPNDPNNAGGEANLDIQYIMGVAPGSPTTFWSIKANSTVEIDDILAWCLQMANTTNPPLVNSLSYGMTEGNVDTYLGAGYLARSDIEFQKLASRGITVIIACGDAGAGDLGPPPMSAQTCDVLHADWPSQSPYVTAVGSTIITPVAEPICYLPPSQGGINCDANPLGEIVVGMDQGLFWTTGGGFSNITGTAPYQIGHVERYLTANADLLPSPGTFNPQGRAYPDVSCVGHNLMVALNGVFIPVDGTSASAPIFAGVVTLLNNERMNAGKAPLGFLNPMLYAAQKADRSTFYDVSVGSNRCGTVDYQPYCCERGFLAAPGWDPASGLGTPNYQSLLKYVMALP